MNEEMNNEKKSKKIGFKILIIVLVLSVLVLGALIAKKKLDEKKENYYDNTVYNEEVKIDASLATQPLTDAFIKGLTNFNIKAEYSNTDPAYTKLINKKVDLIVVTEPSKEELKRAKDAGVSLEVTPVDLLFIQIKRIVLIH